MNADLYLDNRRSPGYTRVEPSMANNVFYGFVGEHKTGRYSKAHAHMSAAILVCLKGKGYTYTWPRTDGMTPWKDGKTKNIYRQDYEPVGLVTAAPYGGDWFHAHFGISKEPLRLIGWYGPNNHRKDKPGVPGEKDTDEGAIDVTEGGTAIPYWLEDPFLRKEYEETLKQEGVKSDRWAKSFIARRPAIAKRSPPERHSVSSIRAVRRRRSPSGGYRVCLPCWSHLGPRFRRDERIIDRGTRRSWSGARRGCRVVLCRQDAEDNRWPAAGRRRRRLRAAGAASSGRAICPARRRSWCRTCRAPAA